MTVAVSDPPIGADRSTTSGSSTGSSAACSRAAGSRAHDPADVKAGSTAGFFATAREGARDITPMVIGVIPFGLAIGASIGSSTVGTAQGIASGPLILAGAAQLSTLRLLEGGAAPLIVILSALMINARILLYSASLAPWFASEPLRRRLFLAVPVIDQLHFTCTPRFERGDLDAAARRWYYIGAATWLVTAWTVSQFVAAVGGARLPGWMGLDLAAPLALAGLLAKTVDDRRTATAAVIAAAATVAAVGLPLNSAVLVATVVALVVASVAPIEARKDRP